MSVGVLLYVRWQAPSVSVRGQSITIEIADTDDERQAGLSNRSSLKSGHGMLFIFPNESKQVFWNQDMKFPIDVVWIKGDRIVNVDHLPLDSGENVRVAAPQEIDKVLELNKGDADKYSIKPGETITVHNSTSNAL